MVTATKKLKGRTTMGLLGSVIVGLSVGCFLLSCQPDNQTQSAVKGGGNTIGNYRGIDKVDQGLAGRLVAKLPAQPLSRYISYDLKGLMGTYTTYRGNVVFENGLPNQMNSMLWDLVIKNFSRDIGSLCLQDPSKRSEKATETLKSLKPEVTARLKSLCSWPEASVKNETLLSQLWLTFMSYDAPESEFLVWKDYFLNEGSPYASTGGQETLTAMITSMLLNPYFLLEQ